VWDAPVNLLGKNLMGLFNILNADVKCSNCDSQYRTKLQFKFGDTWQFEYNLGDTIKWGGNDKGIPNQPQVKVYGIVESRDCPLCGFVNAEEYEIVIQQNRIVSISILQDKTNYNSE